MISVRSLDKHESEIGKYISDDQVHYEYDTTSLIASIVKYSGTQSELIIPSSIVVNEVTYNVTTIEDRAFSGTGLESVILPETIHTIGNGAFCENRLWSLVLPDSIITIGKEAFARNRLTSLELGNSLEEIEYSAFSNNKLIHVTIPDTLRSIGRDAFHNNQLTTVNIGAAVTTIKEGAFSQNQLTNVVIPNSVMTIEDNAFDHNFMLHSVVIPSSVTSVGSNIFGLTLLETIYTDDGHAEILIDILNPRAMSNIMVDNTIISESPLRYHENVSLEQTVAIGDSISFEIILGIKYIHDNSAMTWNRHISQVQWYKDGDPIPDAIEPHFSLSNIEVDGTYYVIVDEDKLEDIQIKVELTSQPVHGRLDNIPINELPDDNSLQQYENFQVGTNDHTMNLFSYFSMGLILLLVIFRLLYIARRHR
jgi:hypothetical protein